MSPSPSSPGPVGSTLVSDEVVATMRALASGHLAHAAALGDDLAATDVLLADVVRADVAARMAQIGCAQLRDLDARVTVEAPDEPLLRWWVVAMLGERALLDADLGAVPLAVAALAEMPDEAFAATPVLYVRGRLRRIAAAVSIVAPSPATIAEHLELRDAAIADFLRCDFPAEAALTRGLSAALAAIATWDDVDEHLATVEDIRTNLGDQEGSIWVPLLDELAVLVAVTAGEVEVAAAAVEALEDHRGAHRVFGAFAAFGRAAVDVMASGASPASIDTLTGALDWLARTHPQLLAQTLPQAANLCADHGADAARRFGAAGLDWPAVSPAMAVRGRLLGIRLALLDGARPPLGPTIDLLDELAAFGVPRLAGATALRLAADHRRAGIGDGADELRTWALLRLPDRTRWTAAERGWDAAASSPGAPDDRRVAARPTDASTPRRRATDRVLVAVRVLAPTLEVDVDGRPVVLRDMAAKLLLVLVLSHPTPVHVERAVDVLWPELDVRTGRRRLNTVVYRLRQELGLDPAALRRSGAVLVLDPAVWEVDLHRWRAELDAGGDRADAALGSVRGNLCQAQFPYDETFVDERRAVSGIAERAIRSLAAERGERPIDGDRVLAVLGSEVVSP